VETPMLNRIDKGCLLKNFSDTDYQLYTTEQWSNDVLLKQQALDQTENVILKDIKFKMLDLPELHSFVEPRSAAFFNVLSRVEDFEIF
jgi:hypothetical protein